MAKTLLNLRTSVRDHIDEPTANYWTDLECNRAISNRYLELWARVSQLKKDYFLSPTPFTLTLVSGQYKYGSSDGVPSTLWRVTAMRTTTSGSQDVQWVPDDPNSPAFISGLRSDVVVNSPLQYRYAVRGAGVIWVSPLPQAAITVSVDYILQAVAVSSDSDTFVLPDAYLDFVEYMATHDLLLKGPVGDPPSWKGQAEAAWERIKIALDTPRQDQGPDLVIGMFDGADT